MLFEIVRKESDAHIGVSMKHEITLEKNPAAQDVEALRHGLLGHMQSLLGETSSNDIAFLLRDDRGAVQGGVHGNYGSFGWLHIDTLFVADHLRGRGYANQLMNLIEAEAVRNGCRYAYLDTFSFQAPEFYKRRGYTVFAELEDFPAGHTRYFLRKKLEAR